ncbi:hypothetical protein QUA81_30620 [Microcoleus sp. F6_B4]
MTGINRELSIDTKHVAKHLPHTFEMQKLLKQEGSVHVFNDLATMEMVAQAIIANGEFIGVIRGHERYGLYFPDPIGYRLDSNNSRIPLKYGEIKIKGDKYHVIPRTQPSR